MSDFEVLKQNIFEWVGFSLDISNADGISDTEVSAIERVVVDERRQEILGAIASRATVLHQELDSKQHIVNTVLKSLEIHQPNVNLFESTPQEKKRIEQFERAKNCNGNIREFLKIIADEPSFNILLPVVEYDGYSGRTGYDLREWCYDRQDRIKRRYGGSNYSSFTRAAKKVSLNINRIAEEMPEICEKTAYAEEAKGDLVYDSFAIADASEFLRRMLRIENFGYKSAVAVLAISDIQAEER